MAKAPVSEISAKGLAGRMLKGFAANLLADAVIKPITTLFSVLFMWVFHSVMKMSPLEGKKLIQRITDTYNIKAEEWVPWVTKILNSITGGKLDAAELVKGGTVGSVAEQLKLFSKNVMTDLLALIVPGGNIDEKKSLEAAEAYLSVNMDFQMKSWLLHLLGDVQSFGMFKSLKDLPNAISWSFGLGWLSWLVMGTPFQESIVTGLRWMFKRKLRPFRFTPAQASELLRRGKITRAEFNEYCDIEGIRDEDKDAFYALSERDQTDGTLRDGFLSGFYTEAKVFEELARKNHSYDRARTLIDFWRYDRYQDLLKKLYGEYEDLFMDDRVKEAELRAITKLQGYTPQEQDLLVDIAEAKKVKAKTLSKSEILAALKAKVIGVAAARTKLLNSGYSAEDVDVILRTGGAE